MNTVLLRTGGSFVFALLFSSVVLTSQSLAGSAPTCGVAQFPPAFDLSDNDPGNSSATYSYAPGADLGFGDSRPDAIVVSFQGSAYGATGSYVLNAAPNDNLSTCEVCVLVYADMDAGNTRASTTSSARAYSPSPKRPGPPPRFTCRSPISWWSRSASTVRLSSPRRFLAARATGRTRQRRPAPGQRFPRCTHDRTTTRATAALCTRKPQERTWASAVLGQTQS